MKSILITLNSVLLIQFTLADVQLVSRLVENKDECIGSYVAESLFSDRCRLELREDGSSSWGVIEIHGGHHGDQLLTREILLDGKWRIENGIIIMELDKPWNGESDISIFRFSLAGVDLLVPAPLMNNFILGIHNKGIVRIVEVERALAGTGIGTGEKTIARECTIEEMTKIRVSNQQSRGYRKIDSNKD